MLIGFNYHQAKQNITDISYLYQLTPFIIPLQYMFLWLFCISTLKDSNTSRAP